MTDDFAFSGWSTVSSARHLPCPLVTRVQMCVVLGWGKFKCFRPKTRQWLILGAEPEDSGQGPSTPLCLKLQLRRPATPWPVPVRLRSPTGQLVAPLGVTPGARRGHELYLPPGRASEVGCELIAGRARTPGPGSRAALAQPGQVVLGHIPPGAGPPAALTFTPTALPRLPDTHVLGDSPL